MTITPIKRALLSVSDKTGIVEFARQLVELGVEIISTGGTSQLLQEAKITHKAVEEITGLPEMLEGRVKTLHPAIHGGILGKRDQHAEEAAALGIGWIDLVVVNFYPFAQATQQKNLSPDEAVEYIDIGGPTMVRAAAKNYAWVGVVVDPVDYGTVLQQLREQGGLMLTLRQQLAAKVFALTSRYDAMIHDYFLAQQEKTACPSTLSLSLKKKSELRYGENPHQKACAYEYQPPQAGILSATLLQGKPLSFNNILDAEAAWMTVSEFTGPTAVIVKHANPCGVASAETIDQAYARAYQTDALSAFGGIIALNRPCTKTIAEAITAIFMEVVLAPAYTEEAKAVLATKPNLRVLHLPESAGQGRASWEMKFIIGGVLLQERDTHAINAQDLKIVTRQQPSAADIEALLFAWRVVKHIKSNAILIAKDQATVGIGAGQVSRVDAVEIALRKAGDKLTDTVLASDAFFPFRDSIDRIAKTGVRAIIQPGGSVRDEEIIAACDEYGIAMVFTGTRCFKH